MQKRHRSIVLPVLIGLVILGGGVWYTLSLRGETPGTNGEVSKKEEVKELSIQPTILDTNDAYVRYVQRYTTGAIPEVKERNVHPASDIDWNTQTLAALNFSIWSAQSFLKAEIETIDGAQAYVIEIRDAPSGCSSTQDQATHLAFVPRLSDTQKKGASLPVFMRVLANPNSCDDLKK